MGSVSSLRTRNERRSSQSADKPPHQPLGIDSSEQEPLFVEFGIMSVPMRMLYPQAQTALDSPWASSHLPRSDEPWTSPACPRLPLMTHTLHFRRNVDACERVTSNVDTILQSAFKEEQARHQAVDCYDSINISDKVQSNKHNRRYSYIENSSRAVVPIRIR